MRKLRWGFFDWNGTLLRDLDLEYEGVRARFEYFGIQPPSKEVYRASIGSNFMDFYYDNGIPKTASADDLNRIRLAFLENHWNSVKLNEGSLECIDLCRSLDMKTAIVSAEMSGILFRRLHQFGIEFLFDFVWGDAHPKKDFLSRVVKQLGAVPEESFYIGDTVEDVELTKELGLKSFGFTQGYAPDQAIIGAQPDYPVRSFNEVSEIIVS